MSTDAIIRSQRPWGKLLAAGLIALSVTTGSGCFKEEPLSDLEYTERAQDHLDKGEVRTALIELKNALQQNPHNIEARRLLGEVYLQLGNGAAAQKELEQALAGGMPRSLLAKPLARAYLLQQQYRKLTEETSPYDIASGPERAEFLILRGRAYQALGKPEQAQTDFQSALQEQPGLWEAMLELGRLALLRGDFTSAKQWLDQAMAAAPDKADLWVLQGDYELNQRYLSEAEAAYRKALALDPQHFNARLAVATALLYQNKPDEARKELAVFQGVARNHPEVNYRLGAAAYQKGEYPVAQERLQEAVNAQPTNLQALLLLGATHYVLGNLGQADTAVQQVLAGDARSLPAHKLKAAIYLRRNQPERASGLLKTVLPQNAEDRQLLAMLGEAAIKAGDIKTATAAVEKVAASSDGATAARMAKRTLALLEEGDTAGALDTFEFAVQEQTNELKLGIWEVQNHLRQQQFDQALQVARKLAENFPKEPIPLNLQALALLGKGDAKAAQESLRQALALRPNDPSTLMNLAGLETQQGQLEQARQHYLQALEQPVSRLPALLHLAALDERLGRPAEAKSWLERAARESPEAARPRVLLARSYLQAGQPLQALAVFQDTQQRFQDNPAVLEVIGRAQLAANESAAAIATFEKLAQLAPNKADIHYLLGKAYASAGNTERLRAQLTKALAIEPEHFDAQVGMARLLVLENKSDQARQYLDKLKKAHAAAGEVLDLQGQLALQQQQPQDAIKAFREGLERFQTRYWADQLALVQWRLGNRKDSLATLETWLQAHPEDAATRYRLAMAYMLDNRRDQAKAVFTQLLERQPDDVQVLNNFAWLLREEDPDRALKYAERALTLAPDQPPIMDTLAMVLLQKGQTERAVELLRRASTLAPDNPEMRFHFAQALARHGDKVQARAILKPLLADPQQRFAGREEAEALLKTLGE